MNYVETVLMPGEKIIEKAQIHWFIFVSDGLLLLLALVLMKNMWLLSAGIAVVVIFTTIKDIIYYLTTELALTR